MIRLIVDLDVEGTWIQMFLDVEMPVLPDQTMVCYDNLDQAGPFDDLWIESSSYTFSLDTGLVECRLLVSGADFGDCIKTSAADYQLWLQRGWKPKH